MPQSKSQWIADFDRFSCPASKGGGWKSGFQAGFGNDSSVRFILIEGNTREKENNGQTGSNYFAVNFRLDDCAQPSNASYITTGSRKIRQQRSRRPRGLGPVKRRIRLRGINGDVDGKSWNSETILRAGRLAT